MRRPCFVEDDGLASIVGVNNTGRKSGGALMVRRNSLRNIGSLVSTYSPRSARLFDEESHFLQSCFLCRKNLGLNNDIYMYRGDTPFCSEECRQEQIDIDESAENKRTLKAFRKIKDSSKTSSKSSSSLSSSPAQSYSLRTGAVTAS